MKAYDYLGNEYSSLTEMCKHYGIPLNIYTRRLKSDGWTRETALTTPVKEYRKRNEEAVDHLGNRYKNIAEMCAHYGISRVTFDARRKIGWDLEEALTLPAGTRKDGSVVKDHLGNTYSSVNEMCRHYNLPWYTYNNRKKLGWTLEEILTKPVGERRGHVEDHLGNVYTSYEEMCEHYGIPYSIVHSRVSNYKWSLEKALTTPVRGKKITITDHLGNTYSSKEEMCAHYNITYNTYCYRKKKGWSMEEALTTPMRERNSVSKMRQDLQDAIDNSNMTTEQIVDIIRAASADKKNKKSRSKKQ